MIIWFLGGLTAFAVLVALFATLLDLLAEKAFHFEKTPHKKTPADEGIDFEELSIPGENGDLYGWWIPSENAKANILLVHGWSRNVERMLAYVRILHGKGFNLLVFDLRGHGSSYAESKLNMLKFSHDICLVLDFLQERPEGNLPTGAIGLSIGGAAAIHASGIDERLKAIVTVGAFAHPEHVMKLSMQNHGLPFVPIGWLLHRYLEIRMQLKFDKIAPMNNIGKSTAKFFLIHGEIDKTAPIGQVDYLAEHARDGNCQVWKIANRGHSDCHREDGFWGRIVGFVKFLFD